MTIRGAMLAALGAAIAAGCDSPPRNALLSCEQDVQVLPARTDLLFVVDDSRSMAEEQDNLRRNLAAFVGALAASPVPNDFRIGVTTTDVHPTEGNTPFFPSDVAPFNEWFPGYAVAYAEGAIVAIDPGAFTDDALRGKPVYDQTNGYAVPGAPRILTPAQLREFETNVLVGARGSGKEEPLRAVELALAARIQDGTNAGFLRPGARLGIVILTDEDDCSERVPQGGALAADTNDECHDATVKATQLLSPAEFVSFLDGPIAGEERRPVVGVIAGFDPGNDLAPTGCATSFDDPTRLADLLDLLGDERAFRGSICDEEFGPSLERIADLLVPQTVPIDGAPPDARMLIAGVERAGETVRCPVAAAGTADAAQAGAIYTAPQAGRPATLTFQRECRLRSGDRVALRVVCAR